MKKTAKRNSPGYGLKENAPLLLLAALFFIITACGAPLKVSYKAAHPLPPVKDPVSVLVTPFKDARDEAALTDPRTIGSITVPVADMNGDKLTLSEDVPSIVTSAYEKELSSAGFDVRAGKDPAGAEADFILSGEVRRFTLDIKERDRIDIEISSSLRESETGRVIWEGTEAVKEERFAGVMGNSRASISNYISRSLSRLITKSISEAGQKVSSTKAAYAPVQPKKEGAEPSFRIEPPAGTGRIVVATEPPRSKVYINDIYYGLTPLTVDIDPGVHEVSIRQSGYKTSKEKVSVRAGQMTEMETRLEKGE